MGPAPVAHFLALQENLLKHVPLSPAAFVGAPCTSGVAAVSPTVCFNVLPPAEASACASNALRRAVKAAKLASAAQTHGSAARSHA